MYSTCVGVLWAYRFVRCCLFWYSPGGKGWNVLFVEVFLGGNVEG